MHIDFKKVILHNFMSYGHAELNFNDDGFIRVTGINESPDDQAVSNGSGKSSLWESIVWAITGDTIRGTKQISNIYGDDGTYVYIEFLVDSKLYQITRSKDHKEYKTNLKIVIDGIDSSGKGIRDSEKLLVQYLPDITPSLLGSVIILGQGLPQKFTNNSPSGRKEVLEKLSKSDFMIEDLKIRVTNRKQEINDLMRSYQDAIISIQSKIQILEMQVAENRSKLQALDKSSIEAELKELDQQEKELTKNTEVQNQIVDDFAVSLDQHRELNNQKLMEYNSNLDEIRGRYQSQIELIRDRMIQYETEYKSLKAELSRIQNIKDICPTCGQKLSGVHRPDTTDLEARIDETYRTYQDVKSEYEQISNAEKSEIHKFKVDYDMFYMTYSTELKAIENNKISAQSQLDCYKRELADIRSKQTLKLTELAGYESTWKNLTQSIGSGLDTISTLNEELLYNNTNKDLQQSRLDVINKFDTALKRDFRGYLLSTIIEYIQLRAKKYSKMIFETDKITFALDGNNIDISYLEKSYENLSGGEKQKIDLIVQFSIRDMLCNHLGFTSNILVLDEVFDGLDMIGCQKVLDVISTLTDIKNIFIVTHRKDLSIPSDKEITVVKSETGISEIRY